MTRFCPGNSAGLTILKGSERGRKSFIAQMSTRLIRRHCAIDEASEKLLETAITRMGFSDRAHDRIREAARGIAHPGAGLQGVPSVESPHIAEAVQYRSLDRTYWA